MRRRLLQRLQKRVECVLGQHVDFVDDVDLVACRNRRITHRLNDLPDIVHAGIRSRVHLDDVHVPPLGDGNTSFAHPARIDRGALFAIERLGDQPCSRRLADAPHTGQEEGMGQPVALDRIAKRRDHCILPDQFGKTLWPVFARKHAIGCGRRRLWRLTKIE